MYSIIKCYLRHILAVCVVSFVRNDRHCRFVGETGCGLATVYE